MRRLFWLLLLPSLAVAQGKPPLDVLRDFVLTDKDAVGMLPAKVVCEFTATEVDWSPDGRYVLLVRNDPNLTPAGIEKSLASATPPPPGDTTVLLVDVAKGTSQAIWSSKTPGTSLNQVEWEANGATALFSIGSIRKNSQTGEPESYLRVYSLNTASGRIQQVVEGASSENISIYLSPTLARGFLKLAKYDPTTKTFAIRAVEWVDGRFGRTCALSRPFLWSQVRWTADGARPVFHVRSEDDQKKERVDDYVLDFASGKTQQVAGLALYKAPEAPAPGVTVMETHTEVKADDKTQPVSAAWLKSAKPSKRPLALIAVDGEATISPKEDAVLLFQQGVVMLRQLVHLPKDAFEAALAAALRMKVISDAKQCALAFLMCASDNDDQYPSNKGDWLSQVNPYLKDTGMLGQFTYTFGGGSLNDIQSPATTELGFMQGEGGRAVAYADGHVTWVPNP